MSTTVERSQTALSPGHKLLWYEIRAVLGRGGFGITYLARDTNLDHLVAIKEYLPPDLAVRTQHDTVHPQSESREETFRWGLDRFIREARTLVKFKHPNIVTVHSVFEANGTAYMVMEYERGIDLEQAVKAGTRLDEEELLGIVHALLDGLAMVHELGFIHRDIKPDNVLLRKDGSPVLLDFGSARESLPSDARTLTTLVTPGFAPFEQYQDARHSDKQGPWSDIYSLGATIYRVITGEGPVDALTRVNAILDKTPDPYASVLAAAAGRFSTEFLAAIDRALAFGVADRPQSVAEWRALFPDQGRRRGRLPDVKAAAEASLAWAEWEARMGGAGQGADAEDAARTASRRATEARAKETHRAWWLGLLLVLFLGGVGIWQGTRRAQVAAPPAGVDPARAATQPARAVPAEDVAALLSAATDAIADLRLTTPQDDNAYRYYRRVLELDPDNAQATRGLALIVERYVELAQSAVAAGEFDKAERYLDAAAGV
ncbi:MAG: protein kinase, partial [Gammaproteobacteria bacterium]|nr:protein kinase [Gammaproteobacteria bacterium]